MASLTCLRTLVETMLLPPSKLTRLIERSCLTSPLLTGALSVFGSVMSSTLPIRPFESAAVSV